MTSHPLETVVDVERYPISDLATPSAVAMVESERVALADRGVAIMPGFVRAEALSLISSELLARRDLLHLEDVWGTPYLDLPDETLPEGHPRRTSVRSLTWVLAYDAVPHDSPARVLYESDTMKDFVGALLGLDPLYRMADPLGALNLTLMEDGHVQGWHYDNADFVVSLAVQASEGGGAFECAASIRTADDERYDDVARVLRGDAEDLVETYAMTPGTLMVFKGRHSLHRVSSVRGGVARMVALFAYDATPDADSTELFKLVRYGRSETLP